MSSVFYKPPGCAVAALLLLLLAVAPAPLVEASKDGKDWQNKKALRAYAPQPPLEGSCPTESECRGHPLCNDCLEHNNGAYLHYGVFEVCAKCACGDIDPYMQGACYTCLAWPRTTTNNGSVCTNCAKLYADDRMGGAMAAVECFSCVGKLDGFCGGPNSCAEPPAYYSDNKTPYTASLFEVKKCWECMREQRFYKWGKGSCGGAVKGGRNPSPKK